MAAADDPDFRAWEAKYVPPAGASVDPEYEACKQESLSMSANDVIGQAIENAPGVAFPQFTSVARWRSRGAWARPPGATGRLK
jgi:hypothetical protein